MAQSNCRGGTARLSHACSKPAFRIDAERDAGLPLRIESPKNRLRSAKRRCSRPDRGDQSESTRLTDVTGRRRRAVGAESYGLEARGMMPREHMRQILLSNARTFGIRIAANHPNQPSLIRRFERAADRSEEHTSELQPLMRTSYAVFRLQKK